MSLHENMKIVATKETWKLRTVTVSFFLKNVKFSGDMRFRYIHGEDGVSKGFADQNQQEARFRMQAEGKVNDNWSVVGRFNVKDHLCANDSGSSAVKMDKLFVKGQMGSFGVRAGRIDVFSAYGIVYDDFMDAIELEIIGMQLLVMETSKL